MVINILLLLYLLYASGILFLRNTKYVYLSSLLFFFIINNIRVIKNYGDYNLYIKFFAENNNITPAPGFIFLRDILNQIFGEFNEITTHLVPFIITSLEFITGILLRSPISIFYLFSSSIFPLLNLNALRQGFAIACFLIGISFFFSRKNLFKEKIYLIIASLFIILGILTHETVLGFFILIILVFNITSLLKKIENSINNDKLKIKISSIFYYGIFLISLIIFIIFSYSFLTDNVLIKASKYLYRNETYNSGLVGSYYRLFTSSLITIPLLIKFVKSELDDIKARFLFSIFIVPFLFAPMSFVAAQLFSRMSYLSFISSFIALSFYRRKYNPKLNILFLISLIGIITYTSSAIEFNLL